MGRNLWTREEEIIVFNLYCKIPFQKSSKFHPEVIRIAKLIGRSPSAVNMKIGNFGRMDPALKEKKITGLTNGSKLDADIWNEFHNNWDELAYQSECLISQLSNSDSVQNQYQSNGILEGGEKIVTVKARINQNFFRKAILSSYGCCCVTGIATEQLLIASHIKPWKDCNANEKTDPRNGLCLNALHDKAYDRGLITVTPDFKIHISKRIKDIYQGKVIKEYFDCYDGKKIIIPEKFLPNKSFLEYHNDMIYDQ